VGALRGPERKGARRPRLVRRRSPRNRRSPKTCNLRPPPRKRVRSRSRRKRARPAAPGRRRRSSRCPWCKRLRREGSDRGKREGRCGRGPPNRRSIGRASRRESLLARSSRRAAGNAGLLGRRAGSCRRSSIRRVSCRARRAACTSSRAPAEPWRIGSGRRAPHCRSRNNRRRPRCSALVPVGSQPAPSSGSRRFHRELARSAPRSSPCRSCTGMRPRDTPARPCIAADRRASPRKSHCSSRRHRDRARRRRDNR